MNIKFNYEDNINIYKPLNLKEYQFYNPIYALFYKFLYWFNDDEINKTQ